MQKISLALTKEIFLNFNCTGCHCFAGDLFRSFCFQIIASNKARAIQQNFVHKKRDIDLTCVKHSVNTQHPLLSVFEQWVKLRSEESSTFRFHAHLLVYHVSASDKHLLSKINFHVRPVVSIGKQEQRQKRRRNRN